VLKAKIPLLLAQRAKRNASKVSHGSSRSKTFRERAILYGRVKRLQIVPDRHSVRSSGDHPARVASLSEHELLEFSYRARLSKPRYVDPQPVVSSDYRRQRDSPVCVLKRGSCYRVGDTRYALRYIDNVWWCMMIGFSLIEGAQSQAYTVKSLLEIVAYLRRIRRIAWIREPANRKGMPKAFFAAVPLFIRDVKDALIKHAKSRGQQAVNSTFAASQDSYATWLALRSLRTVRWFYYYTQSV